MVPFYSIIPTTVKEYQMVVNVQALLYKKFSYEKVKEIVKEKIALPDNYFIEIKRGDFVQEIIGGNPVSDEMYALVYKKIDDFKIVKENAE